MNFGKVKTLLPFFVLSIISFQVTAQTTEKVDEDNALEIGIDILKRYFYEENNWYITKPSVAKDVRGLINFIEDDPIDSVLNNIFKSFSQKQTYVFRLPENVEDSLNVPGYCPLPLVEERIRTIGSELQREFENRRANVPPEMFENLDVKLNLIPKGKGLQLFTDAIYTMPQDLQIPEVIPDSVLNSPADFERLVPHR